MLPADQIRLQSLLDRLRELEQRPVLAHERSIVEVARAFLTDAIRDLSHQLHDHDYQRQCPPCGEPRRGSVA
jgi:hypothetical protein